MAGGAAERGGEQLRCRRKRERAAGGVAEREGEPVMTAEERER